MSGLKVDIDAARLSICRLQLQCSELLSRLQADPFQSVLNSEHAKRRKKPASKGPALIRTFSQAEPLVSVATNHPMKFDRSTQKWSNLADPDADNDIEKRFSEAMEEPFTVSIETSASKEFPYLNAGEKEQCELSASYWTSVGPLLVRADKIVRSRFSELSEQQNLLELLRTLSLQQLVAEAKHRSTPTSSPAKQSAPTPARSSVVAATPRTILTAVSREEQEKRSRSPHISMPVSVLLPEGADQLDEMSGSSSPIASTPVKGVVHHLKATTNLRASDSSDDNWNDAFDESEVTKKVEISPLPKKLPGSETDEDWNEASDEQAAVVSASPLVVTPSKPLLLRPDDDDADFNDLEGPLEDDKLQRFRSLKEAT